MQVMRNDILQTYLDNNNITRYRVNKINGITATTLQNASNRSTKGTDTLTRHIIKSVAVALITCLAPYLIN